MPKQSWKPIDLFIRERKDLQYLRLLASLGGMGGDLVAPMNILGLVADHFPASDLEHTRTLPFLNRSTPLIVTNENDLRYARKRNFSRPIFQIDGDTIRVQLENGIDQVFPANVEAIKDYIASKSPPVRRVEKISGETIGIIYMCFGERAAKGVRASIATLEDVGLSIPVTVIGSTPVEGADFVKWWGENPFDSNERHNFQFRAGRVKPHLATRTPYNRTLYVDADTEFLGDILPGFELLDDYEMALTEEILTLGQLYNKRLAGWEINLVERDDTIAQLGDARRKFINSGVIFFRTTNTTLRTWAEWYRQWLQYQQWDEQLALMRALDICKPRYKALGVEWNHPHREQAQIIFHNYGRGHVRMDNPKEA